MAKEKRGAQTAKRQSAEKTFEQVEQLVAEKNIPKSAAFKEVAKATGRKPGTVAVVYYRFAQRKRGGAAATRRGARRTAGGSVVQRANAVIKELASLVQQQQREIDRLRKESAWVDKLRRALRD